MRRGEEVTLTALCVNRKIQTSFLATEPQLTKLGSRYRLIWKRELGTRTTALISGLKLHLPSTVFGKNNFQALWSQRKKGLASLKSAGGSLVA